MNRLLEHDVTRFKCATSLELLCACEAGAADVVVAYPLHGAAARRVRRIAEKHPDAVVSALVESTEQIEPWRTVLASVYSDWVAGAPDPALAQQMLDRLMELTE